MDDHNNNNQHPGGVNRAVPLVGQPFSFDQPPYIPITVTLHCNCGGADVIVKIVQSVAAACPSCRRVFNVAGDVSNVKLNILMTAPKVESIQ